MAKGPIITDEVKQIIASVYLANIDWRAKEIQREVNNLCKGRGSWLSAVQKVLTKVRRSYDELAQHWEEDTWSLFSYYHFEVPPDALPIVLQVWLRARIDDKMPVTNREVKWVVRLYKVINDVKMLKNRAKDLAINELIGEILGIEMMGHPGRPLHLIEDMTGEEFSKEEASTIMRASLPENYHRGLAQQHIKELDSSRSKTGGKQ